MATITVRDDSNTVVGTLTLPTGALSRIVDAVAALEGYIGTDIAGNPQTKAQFFKTRLIAWLVGRVRDYEGTRDADAARTAAVAKATSEVTIT